MIWIAFNFAKLVVLYLNAKPTVARAKNTGSLFDSAGGHASVSLLAKRRGVPDALDRRSGLLFDNAGAIWHYSSKLCAMPRLSGQVVAPNDHAIRQLTHGGHADQGGSQLDKRPDIRARSAPPIAAAYSHLADSGVVRAG